MSRLSTIIFLLGVLATHLTFIFAKITDDDEPPGLINRRLTPCEGNPNCICSEFERETHHFSSPLSIPPHLRFDLLPVIKETIESLQGHIQTATETYIAATFSSYFFKIIDDFEIRIDRDNNVIHIRSASRAGYTDLGANRNRVRLFKNRVERAIRIKHLFDRSPHS